MGTINGHWLRHCTRPRREVGRQVRQIPKQLAGCRVDGKARANPMVQGSLCDQVKLALFYRNKGPLEMLGLGISSSDFNSLGTVAQRVGGQMALTIALATWTFYWPAPEHKMGTPRSKGVGVR